MFKNLSHDVRLVLVSVLVSSVVVAIPATAAVYVANTDKVDNKHAVGSATPVDARKGKLVATSAQTGRLPNNIIVKAPDADKVDGLDASDLVGATGPAGPAGPAGAQGDQGLPGPQGEPGVVSMARTSGGGSSLSAAWDFLAVPVSVTVAGGQRVLVTSSKVLGSTAAGGAANLDIDICRRIDVPGATVVTSGLGGLYGIRVAQNTRVPMTLTMYLSGLSAGTYQVGLCGKSDQAANWNFNEYSYTTALVLN